MIKRLWVKLKESLGLGNGEENSLLDQKYIDLRSSYETLKLSSGYYLKDGEPVILENVEPIASKIESLFEKDKSMANCNHIEQLLVFLYNDSELDVYIQVKLQEARLKLREEMLEFYTSQFEKTQGIDAKRMLASNLNKRLQWISEVERLERLYITKTRVRTGFWFILSITLFFMIDQLPVLAELLNVQRGEQSDFIVKAMTSGCMGSAFSMLISLKNKVDISSFSDLKIIHRFDYILSRALIGMVGGLLLLYAFQAQLLFGDLFPSFSFSEGSPVLDAKNKALFIVWCFISGFSEKLVPNLLVKTGSKAEVDNSDRKPQNS